MTKLFGYVKEKQYLCNENEKLTYLLTKQIREMVSKLGKTLTLTGASGKQYEFQLFSFDDYEEIKRYFNEVPALYIFVRLTADKLRYEEVIYLGETGNVHTRYDNHHRENCIKSRNANCIGFYQEEGFGIEANRKAAEKDLLDANIFHCNRENN